MGVRVKEIEDGVWDAFFLITAEKEHYLIDEAEGYYQLWAEGDYLYIKSLDINIFRTMFKTYDNENDCYVDDRYIYVIFDNATGANLYMEDGPLSYALYCFCGEYGPDLSMDEVLSLSCIYPFDNGRFLKAKVLPNITTD